MLKAFSWQDFLLAATILSLVWWLGIYLRCFWKKGGRAGSGAGSTLPHSWENEVDNLEVGLMGKPVLEHGVSVVEAEDFSFGGAEMEDAGDSAKLEQLGDLADVQQEIREVCRVLAAEDGTKEDFFMLFEMLKGKYPGVASSPSLDALNGFIREQVPFALSEQELEDLWL